MDNKVLITIKKIITIMFGWWVNENKSRFIGFRNFMSSYHLCSVLARVYYCIFPHINNYLLTHITKKLFF